MSSGQILILCNGEVPTSPRFFNDHSQSDFFICADGGANTARKLGITPDIILGDFDSLLKETRAHFSSVQFLYDPDQQTTDFEKSVAFALKKNPHKIIIWGASGDRYDHTIGNYSSLVLFDPSCEIVLCGNNYQLQKLPFHFQKSGTIGTTISLLPMPIARNIVTTGLKWPLQQEDLEIGVRVGTLNQTIDINISISYTSGHLLMMEIIT